MGDMIVTDIAMQALEEVTLIPANFTTRLHRFSVSPPLPAGLSITPTVGVIQGHTTGSMPKTIFTISLHTPGRQEDCIIIMEFSVSTHMDLFHGQLIGGDSTLEFRILNMGPQPSDWQVVAVDEEGMFELHVLFMSFQLRFDSHAYVNMNMNMNIIF